MAKLYAKENRMQKNWKWCKRISAAAWRLTYVVIGLAAASVFGGFYLKADLLFYALIPETLLAVIFYLLHFIAAKQAAMLNAGVVGENTTRQLIRHLSAGYTAITNVRVTYDGNTSELDMVVVGPTGVFVIETKNYSGTITGRAEESTWKRTKRSDTSHAYATSFYSPIKQVSTHAYRLSKFLKQNQFFVWVQGIVYFSDSAATVKISGNTKRIPIFRAEPKTSIKQNKLLRYIRSFPTQKKLSPKTVDRIVRLLRA